MKTSLPTRCITAGFLILLLAVSITTSQRVASAHSTQQVTKPVKKTHRIRVTPKPAHLPPPHKKNDQKSHGVKRASVDASFPETLTISLTPPNTSTPATRGLIDTAFDTAVCVTSSDDGAAVGEEVTVSLASGATTTVTMGANGCGTATLTPLAADAGTATITASVPGENGTFASGDPEEIGEYGPASATTTVTVASLDCGDSILLTPDDIATIVNAAQASGLFTDDEIAEIRANACLVSHPVVSPINVALAGDTSSVDADLINSVGGNDGDVIAANPPDGNYDVRLNFNWPLALTSNAEVNFVGWKPKSFGKKGDIVASVAVGLEYQMKRVNGQWDGNVYNVSILSLKRQEASLAGFQANFSWTGPTVVNGAGKGVYEFATDGQSHSSYGKTWRAQVDATLGLKFSVGIGPISASADATIDKLNGAEVIVNGQNPNAAFNPSVRQESYTTTQTTQNT